MSSIADLLEQNGQFGRDKTFLSPGGLVQGTVTDNDSDKEAGMVKVEFTAWTSGKNVCEWVPLLHPYAGREHGSYLVPEVGDIVLVGFIGTDYRRPVVLGSLFPATAPIKRDSFEKKNTLRRFKTKGGIDLTLSDEKGSEYIQAETPDGLCFRADDGKKTVTLRDKNGKNQVEIDCAKGALNLTAGTKITIKAGSCQISLDGQTGKLELSCGMLDVKATQKADLDGGQMLNLKGGMLKAEGTQTATLKGSAMTEVSGGMVKLG